MKKTILIIPPLSYPIPAIEGGAVETLITSLIHMNEKYGEVRLIVVSKNNEIAKAQKYKNTKIYYFNDDQCEDFQSIRHLLSWKAYCLWRKVFQNRLICRLVKCYPQMDEFVYQCRSIAKKENVDALVIEGGSIWLQRWDVFNYLLGKENVWFHLHATIDEKIEARKCIQNYIAISDYVRNAWVVTHFLPGRNSTLYNGININKFCITLSEDERNTIRANYEINKDEFVVIFCGRISPEKGIQQLVEAFELIKDLPIKLLMVGSATFGNDKESAFSREMIEKAKKIGNIVPVGFIHNDKLPKLYKISDIQVIPSVWQEGAGLVAVEGMASGLPLIITKSGGMVEYTGNECCIQLPINDELSKNIANAIRELYYDSAKRDQMKNSGLKRAKLFSEETYYKKFLAIVRGDNDAQN